VPLPQAPSLESKDDGDGIGSKLSDVNCAGPFPVLVIVTAVLDSDVPLEYVVNVGTVDITKFGSVEITINGNGYILAYELVLLLEFVYVAFKKMKSEPFV
jgi:hypothetical protein